MNKTVQNIQKYLKSNYEKLVIDLKSRSFPEFALIIGTSLIVGIGAGLGAVVFKTLVDSAQKFTFEDVGGWLSMIAPWHLVIIPMVGGLITGPIIYRFAREAKGHGVPEVMEAVALRGGKIRPQVGLVKAVASAICIGTGGSVGSEGPIAQIGSALGSTIGQVFKLSEERTKTLVACGAAGGIAAIFNAPIAGAIFAMEVILNRINTVYFGAVVISAVAADAVAHMFIGNNRTFLIPQYKMESPWELLLYALLAIIAAFASVGFSRILYWSEDVFEKIKMPEWLKPALGGLLLGLLGLVTYKTANGIPRVYGVGYETITPALFGEMAAHVTLLLFLLKLLATLFTLGSGGSGGIFAPSLFMGSMLGASYGKWTSSVFPNIAGGSGAYALVGMAAFFSGATHAPMTAILILFEMTNNYQLILPLMLTTVLSTFISRVLSKDSIYTLKLTRKGIQLSDTVDIDVMQGVNVEEVMTRDFDFVTLDMTLKDLDDLFIKSHKHGYPVVSAEQNLVGVVTVTDLDQVRQTGTLKGKFVADIATTQGLMVTYPDEPMWKALYRMGAHNIGRLPVLEKEGSRKIIGVVRRHDIIKAYDQAITKKARMQHRIETLKLGKLDDAGFINLNIPANSRVIGKRVSEIKLPGHCVIVSLRRGRRLQVVDGYTILKKGDRLTIFAEETCVDNVEKSLVEPSDLQQFTGQPNARHQIITIPAGASSVGKMIKDLHFPYDSILVSIHRGNDIIIPHGDTILQTEDEIEIFGMEDDLLKTENIITK